MMETKRSWISADPANRQKDDFYPTPPEATRALLSVEDFGLYVWEPACGDGAISKILESPPNGYEVLSTDLNDYGYGRPGCDFLLSPQVKRGEFGDAIITNPPFKLAREFAEHALEIRSRKIALLCRLSWLEGMGRKPLFENHLAKVWVFSNRIQLTREGKPMKNSGMVAYAWFIFVPDHKRATEIGWLDSRGFRE